jgi:hypothetical protein
MITDDRIAQKLVVRSLPRGGPLKDQMLLTTAPNTPGLSFVWRTVTDGPEPHLLMPSPEFGTEGALSR